MRKEGFTIEILPLPPSSNMGLRLSVNASILLFMLSHTKILDLSSVVTEVGLRVPTTSDGF